MIYFLQCDTADGLIKIGCSTSVEQRISYMQTGCPYSLRLLGVIRGDMESEQVIHKRFRKYHYRGEWYRPGEELVNYISQFARGEGLESVQRSLETLEGIMDVLVSSSTKCATPESIDLDKWKRKAVKRKIGRAVDFSSRHIRPALRLSILAALEKAESRLEIEKIFDAAIYGVLSQ